MRRLLASAVLAGCGPAHQFHKEPEAACGGAAHAIAAREDVSLLAGCTRAGALQIRPAGPLELTALARLESVESLQVGPSVGLGSLALPRLREVRGTLRIASNHDLRSISLPALERAGRVELDGNTSITNLAVPKLATVSAVVVTGNPELELLDLGALATVDELAIAGNAKLAGIEGTPQARAARIEDNPQLPADVAERLRARSDAAGGE